MSVQTNHTVGLQQIFRRVRKIANATIHFMSVRLSVRASVRMEQLNSHCTAFYKMLYMSIFRKSVEKIHFHYNPIRIAGTLHEDQYKFLIISGTFLLIMRNVSGKSCRENQNTQFMFNNFFFPKILPFMR